jgi:hypothetical protein
MRLFWILIAEIFVTAGYISWSVVLMRDVRLSELLVTLSEEIQQLMDYLTAANTLHFKFSRRQA